MVGKWGITQGYKKERVFCEVIIKIDFCRKKTKIMLTFKYSNIGNKFTENVYTMVKTDYNGNTEKKRRCQAWHRSQKT